MEPDFHAMWKVMAETSLPVGCRNLTGLTLRTGKSKNTHHLPHLDPGQLNLDPPLAQWTNLRRNDAQDSY